MSDNTTKGSLKTTCIYTENSENLRNLLSESFALFVEKRLAISDVSWYNETCGRLLVGGAKCTRK